MPVIFLSYRRSDSQDVTGRIYDRLVAKFTQKQVLKDVDNIPLGVSFPMHLQQMIGKANVVLVIIGPGWVNATDERGNRRLDDPADFVRVEVEASLRANIPVIPVLVSNASMPKASDLPRSMQKLAERNGTAVRPDPDFNNDIGRLFSGIEHLEKLLKSKKKEVIPTVVPVPTALAVQEKLVITVVPDPFSSSTKPKREMRGSERPSRRSSQDAGASRGGFFGRLILILLGLLGAVALLFVAGFAGFMALSAPGADDPFFDPNHEPPMPIMPVVPGIDPRADPQRALTVRVSSKLGPFYITETTKITIGGETQTIQLDEQGKWDASVIFRVNGPGTHSYSLTSQIVPDKGIARHGKGTGTITITEDASFDVQMNNRNDGSLELSLQRRIGGQP